MERYFDYTNENQVFILELVKNGVTATILRQW